MCENNINLVILFTMVASLCLGCVSIKPQYFEDDLKLAEGEMPTIVKNINDSDVDTLYNNAHPQAREQKSKDELKQTIDGIREYFGHIGEYELVYSKVKMVTANERLVHLFYKTQFENSRQILYLEIVTSDTDAKFYSIGILTSDQMERIKKELEKS